MVFHDTSDYAAGGNSFPQFEGFIFCHATIAGGPTALQEELLAAVHK
jgi:hypothetical protein